MSVQRIDSKDKRTAGWQARVYTVAPRYVSRFFADKLHGGKRKAKALAMEAEAQMLKEREQ